MQHTEILLLTEHLVPQDKDRFLLLIELFRLSKAPGRVFKGKKMPGRMGGDKIWMKSLTVLTFILFHD